MKKGVLFLWILVLFISLVNGCSGKNPASDDEQDFFLNDVKMASLNVRNIYYKAERTISEIDIDADGSIFYLSIGESGNIFGGCLKDGEETIKPVDQFCDFVKYYKAEEKLLVHHSDTGNLDFYDTSYNFQKTLMEGFKQFEIKEVVIRDNRAYMLCVSDNPYERLEDIILDEDKGYIDYGEKIYCLNLDNGELSDCEIKNVISMCDSGSEYLYLYAYIDGHYNLCVFSTKDNKIIQSIETDETGYVFSFAVIGDKMYFRSIDTEGICSLNLKSKTINREVDDVLTLKQSDFKAIDDCLIFVNRNTMEICSLWTTKGVISDGSKTNIISDQESDVVIGCIDRREIPFSISELEKDTDLKIGTYSSPKSGDASFFDKMMVKLMAGDPDVDIYILYPSSYNVLKLCSDDVCYDLGSSDLIRMENSSYFDYISNYFKTPTGKIWGVPLSTGIDVLAVFPDNLDKTDINNIAFVNYFEFMNYLEKIKDTKGIFVSGEEYGYELMRNYISNNSPVDYDSNDYRAFFESMWSGWSLYGNLGYENHPLLGEAASRITDEDGDEHIISMQENRLLINPDETMFHMVSEWDILNNGELFKKAEIYPIPLISSEYSQDIYLGRIAVINPYGKNRDKAVRVMESIVKRSKQSGINGIIYSDINEYGSGFNPDSKLFKELYEIKEKAIIGDDSVLNDIFLNEVPAYQNAEIDLDTAIKSMQRKEDAYRNE